MRSIVGTALLFLAGVVYVLTNSPALREEIGIVATAVARPVVVPLVELINVQAFVYCVALVIFSAGVLACVVHRLRVVGPRLGELRAVRSGLGDLPPAQPRLASQPDPWPPARHRLGELLQDHDSFVHAWSMFVSESTQTSGVPLRTFSSFVAAEPDPRERGDGLMQHLPGYFTSVGLIFTFVGLVVALFFAAKGFRTGDLGEARAAIIQLLNAASFKFLTSVAALISALIVSLYTRYASALVAQDTSRTVERIEIYLASWRERIGSGRLERRLEPADLLRRFDVLLAGVQALSVDMRRLVEIGEAQWESGVTAARDVSA